MQLVQSIRLPNCGLCANLFKISLKCFISMLQIDYSKSVYLSLNILIIFQLYSIFQYTLYKSCLSYGILKLSFI